MAFWVICKINLTAVPVVLLRSYGGNLLVFLSLLLLIVLLAGVTLLVQRRATGLTVGLGFPAAEAKCFNQMQGISGDVHPDFEHEPVR